MAESYMAESYMAESYMAESYMAQPYMNIWLNHLWRRVNEFDSAYNIMVERYHIDYSMMASPVQNHDILTSKLNLIKIYM